MATSGGGPLPLPTGPLAVGRVSYDWVDRARFDIYAGNPQVRRELVVFVDESFAVLKVIVVRNRPPSSHRTFRRRGRPPPSSSGSTLPASVRMRHPTHR